MLSGLSDAIVSSAIGSVTVNVVPRPRRERTEIVPPCAWAIHWLIASPSPKPPRSARARARAIGAIEPLEDVRQVGGRDADAGVAHGERDRAVVRD